LVPIACYQLEKPHGRWIFDRSSVEDDAQPVVSVASLGCCLNGNHLGGVGSVASNVENTASAGAIDDIGLSSDNDLVHREIHIGPRMNWVGGVETRWGVALEIGGRH